MCQMSNHIVPVSSKLQASVSLRALMYVCIHIHKSLATAATCDEATNTMLRIVLKETSLNEHNRIPLNMSSYVNKVDEAYKAKYFILKYFVSA